MANNNQIYILYLTFGNHVDLLSKSLYKSSRNLLGTKQ